MYRIMDREGTAIISQGPHAYEHYVRNSYLYDSENYIHYGAQLWSTKRVKVGFSVKFRLWFRNRWYWKPVFSWRYDKHFMWLFFSIRIEGEYDTVLDEVIMDHLAEVTS